MKKLLIGSSLIAMTAMERAAGRYMRAPDHPTGGEGGEGEGGGGDSGQPPAAAEPTGGEVNDAVEIDDDSGQGSGERQPPATGAEDDSAGDEPGEEGEGKPKPKSVQERIDELTSNFRESERRAAELERDLEYWVGRANGTIKEDGSPVEQSPGEAAESPDDDGAPDPSKYQYGETDAAYIRDLARYEANKAFEEREAQAQTAAQLREVETAHTERVEKAKEVFPDYEEKVIKGADVDPATGQAKWSCSPLMALGIKTSEFGPAIAYHLASNPEESDRIASLHPMEQAKEFGRLEYRAELETKERSGDSGEARPTGVTKAPPPPQRARGAGGKFDVPGDTDDFGAFEQRADAHLKTKKRR